MACKDYPANVKLFRGPADALTSKNANNVPANPMLPLGDSAIDVLVRSGWRLTREPSSPVADPKPSSLHASRR